MERVEHSCALNLLRIVGTANREQYSFFLSSSERKELTLACINLKSNLDWSFNFKEFYKFFATFHYPSLEFLWNLNILQVMPLEMYILNIHSEKEVFLKFTENIFKLCIQDFEEVDSYYLIQTGVLSYFVSKAFPAGHEKSDIQLKKICKETVKKLLLDIFSTKKDEVGSKRFICFFSLWNAGIVEEVSFLNFCLFALDCYFNLVPTVNDFDAFEIIENSSTSISHYHLLGVVEKLLKPLKSDKMNYILTTAVQQSQINAASLLVVVKAFLNIYQDASTVISRLVTELTNEAYEKFNHNILLRALLIGYQAAMCQPNTSPQVYYKLWLQTVFRECEHSKNKDSFSLLIQVLSDIVPCYRNVESLKIAVETNVSVPTKAQTMYSDYITLLKTRIQDLKPSSNPKETVEKVLALFESLGKIPPVVMETSLLQKHKFLQEFLPALLIPRVVPPVPDVRERFIKALDKAGKIPNSILQKYKNDCMQEQNKIIEDINILNENFEDFLGDCVDFFS